MPARSLARAAGFAALLLAGSSGLGSAQEDDAAPVVEEAWFPQSVESREPPFHRGGSFTRHDYVPLAGATERWELCATVPPLMFEYFRALASGLEAEAERQGVSIAIMGVDGFDIDAQAAILDTCLEEGAHALIVGAVARDGLGSVLSRARASGVPVIDVGTGSGSDNVTARIVTDRHDVGRIAGAFLADRHPPGADTARVVWLYGPRGSSVSERIDAGFRAGIERSAVDVVYAEDMGLDEQTIRRTLREVIDEVGTFDSLVGGVRAVQLATEELASAFPVGTVELVSVTLSSSMLDLIEAGRVFAGVDDRIAIQGRIAVDLAIRAIEERPHLKDLRPTLRIVDRGNIQSIDRMRMFPPAD